MNKKVILLVDDNPDDVELTIRAFKKSNIVNQVVVANDGIEALDYLFGTGKHSGRDATVMPSVILLDINMPRLDGIEVLQRLRSDERTKLVPVVILTSSKEEQDLIKGYRFGANSFIRKPVDFVEFIDAVKHLGMYWLLINESPIIQGV